MATKKKAAPRRAVAPPNTAAVEPLQPDILDTVTLMHGNGPVLVGRSSEDASLIYARDESDDLEFIVAGEVVHRGVEWLAPEHFRGQDVTIQRPA